MDSGGSYRTTDFMNSTTVWPNLGTEPPSLRNVSNNGPRWTQLPISYSFSLCSYPVPSLSLSLPPPVFYTRITIAKHAITTAVENANRRWLIAWRLSFVGDRRYGKTHRSDSQKRQVVAYQSPRFRVIHRTHTHKTSTYPEFSYLILMTVPGTNLR